MAFHEWQRLFQIIVCYEILLILHDLHCVKSVRIRSYSGPYFPAYGQNTERYGVSQLYLVQMRENADQNNSEYGHFSRSVNVSFFFLSDLGVTTLLALSYLWSSVNFELPTVTYIKAIDTYFMVSFIFILMSIFEYTLVMNTDFRRKNEKKRDRDRKLSVTSKRMLPPSSKSLLIKHYPKKSMKYNEVSSFFFQQIYYYNVFFKVLTLPQNGSIEMCIFYVILDLN